MNQATANSDAAGIIDSAKSALREGDISKAERLCVELLSSAPANAAAWMVLTETALLRDRPDAAIVCADRSIALLPNDPIARILWAKTLFLAGEARQAICAAETAFQLVGTSPDALDALGAIYGLLGHHHRAAELFRRAVAARPDVPQYLFNLAATERMTGMFEAAENHCNAAISLDRHFSLAHYLRADLRVQTPENNHIEDLEQLLVGGKLGKSGEVMIHFALGKEYEDLGDHDRAFDHVEAGAKLQRRSIDYNNAAKIEEIDRIIGTQTKAWLSRRQTGFATVEPVFVVGLPRTGTTLVERIIASHSEIVSVGETGAFAVELQRAIKSSPETIDFAEIGRRYIDSASAMAVSRLCRLVDKTLQNYLYCGLIHAALPRAKIVWVHRHPLDTCWAIYKAHFQGGFLFSYDQLELAQYYLAFRRLFNHWQSALPRQTFLEVDYEDIVCNQVATSQRLVEFLGLPWEEGVLRFHESTLPSATASAVQIRRSIYSSSVGKWRQHARRLAPLRDRLALEISAEELM